LVFPVGISHGELVEVREEERIFFSEGLIHFVFVYK
jgi:hypothetical protein